MRFLWPLRFYSSNYRRGLSCRKAESFKNWYIEVLLKGGLISDFIILDSYIFCPRTYTIWQNVEIFLKAELKKMQVIETKYIDFSHMDFFLNQRKDIKSYYPEVYRNKVDTNRLYNTYIAKEIIAFWHMRRFITSYRHLPYRSNDWCACVSVPSESTHLIFNRIYGYYLQNGYSVFETEKEVNLEAQVIIESYRKLYEECLAIPVVKGKRNMLKTIGGGFHSCVQVFIPHLGCGIEGASFECRGQDNAKLFGIKVMNNDQSNVHPWINNWTCSSSSIELCAMIHGDDKGLFLPPNIADIQAIVIPYSCHFSKFELIITSCSSIVKTLCDAGVRAQHDLRDNFTPGWKYYDSEMKGIPLRIEIGLQGLEKKLVRIVRRDTGYKRDVLLTNLVEQVQHMLLDIQQCMFKTAMMKRDACIKIVYTFEAFLNALDEKKIILAPWCNEKDDEHIVTSLPKCNRAAKILCHPLDQPSLPEGTLCFATKKPAKCWTYWGVSYDFTS